MRLMVFFRTKRTLLQVLKRPTVKMSAVGLYGTHGLCVNERRITVATLSH